MSAIVEQFLAENDLLEHDLIQGTQEWDAFRLEHDGASEAAAMLGVSKKTKRTELLHAKHTGIPKEFSDWLRKNVLDKGHEVEALARPIVEGALGRKLYPVVLSRGRRSASCDGRTAAGDVVWEHKQWNDDLAKSVRNGILPEEHEPQCYQNLLVSGAEILIFTVSDGTAENMVSMEVRPNDEQFERVILGWEQFDNDRATYVPAEIKEMPKAEVTIDLPALFVHATGKITAHNMDEFGVALTAKLAEVRAIALVNDQDFSNAKEAAKKFRETAKAIALSQKQMLAQTETIGEASLKMEAWVKDLNATALQLEKDVEREDKAKKEVMVLGGKNAYNEHVAALEAEIKPIRLSVTQPDFAGEIKGKRNYASMQNAVDTALANGKITADAQAKDCRAKLDWCKENAAGHHALFPDLQTIITKPFDDFTLLITSRINKQKADEAARLEAERARMETEAKAKAEAEAAAKLKADEERIRAEERAKAEAEATSKLEEENTLIECIWKEARRIEFDSVPYIEKAITTFETCAKDWENDSRHRVAQAVSEARKEMKGKLEIAQAKLKAVTASSLSVESAKNGTQENNPRSEAVKHDGARPALVQMEPAAHVSPSLRLGQINERLFPITLTADGLVSLGFAHAATDKAAKLYHEQDFMRICDALVRHIQAAKILDYTPEKVAA